MFDLKSRLCLSVDVYLRSRFAGRFAPKNTTMLHYVLVFGERRRTAISGMLVIAGIIV